MSYAHRKGTASYLARHLASMWGKSGDLQRRREGLRGDERKGSVEA
jgi:hypothetical protein